MALCFFRDELFFFFKQKTAYEMRISDLSSDVCSSDLAQAAGRTPAHLSSRSCAGTVLMILERLSAIGPMSSHSDGVGYADLKAAAAHSIAMMLGARG